MIDMHHLTGLASALLLASAVHAQDTTVVIVRHIAPQQDTAVLVRHLGPPPPQLRTTAPRRAPRSALRSAPRSKPRYATNSTGVVAKNPTVGTMLSFVFPGGGQYYAGQRTKGLALTLLGIGAPIIGYANVRHDDSYHPGFGGSDCVAYASGNSQPQPQLPGGIFCRGRTDWTPAAIGLGVGITAWLYGVATAGTDVQHWNQTHGVRFVTAPGRMGFAVALP